MKLNLNNIIFFLFVIFFASINVNNASTEKSFYEVFVKLPLAGKLKAQDILTLLTVNNDTFEYSYSVEPTKLVDFFDNRISSGKIIGNIINNQVVPEYYIYKSVKNENERTIEFFYDNGSISQVIVEPPYSNTDITKVESESITESVDPVTMFFNLTNFNFLNNCDSILKIYDGKRRYNLIISDPVITEQSIKCKIVQDKIAGYKLNKIEENKKYISYINFILNKNNEYVFESVSLRENLTDLIISKVNN